MASKKGQNCKIERFTLDVWSKIKEEIQKAKKIYLFFHINPDGDAIGSTLAFLLALKNSQKEVKVFSPVKLPEQFTFLPGSNEILTPSSELYMQKSNYNIKKTSQDWISIVIDCGSIDRVGSKLKKILDNSKLVINIDHHSTNTNFGHINYIEPSASSSSEIIFNLIKDLKLPLTKDVAINIFTGIMTDTGNFKYKNTNKRAFEISSELMDFGIEPAYINNMIYSNRSIKWFKLLGNAISNIQTTENNKICWYSITKEMKAGLDESEIDGIIDVLNWGKDFEVFIQFLETEREKTKISFRSKGQINVDLIAREFGGGGHPTAAGAKINKPIKDAIEEVINKVKLIVFVNNI